MQDAIKLVMAARAIAEATTIRAVDKSNVAPDGVVLRPNLCRAVGVDFAPDSLDAA